MQGDLHGPVLPEGECGALREVFDVRVHLLRDGGQRLAVLGEDELGGEQRERAGVHDAGAQGGERCEQAPPPHARGPLIYAGL